MPLRVQVSIRRDQKSHLVELTTEGMISVLEDDRVYEEGHRKTIAAILSAQAGAGKTFFMRNLYVTLAASSKSKVPIFFEARELNRIPPTDFAGIVTTSFHTTGHELSREQAIDGLKSGLFIILIDGFDELTVAREQHYENVLEQGCREFQLCPILVSGRPSQPFHVLELFVSFELLPLNREDAVQLIQRLTFDETTKRSFIALMRKELFISHSEFLRVPLLCVVMLLTYSDAGRISNRRHEFYEDAFSALWSKHDARKQAGYEREKYTGLEKGDFVRLLSAFCASSYVNEHFSMREEELSSHLTYAMDLTDILIKQEEFLKDMTISTSLLVMEGNSYRFTHRSFQEYFCARFILSLNDGDIANGIEVVSGRYETDTVLM